MSLDSTACAPLSLTREISAFPIGNRPLAEHHRRLVRDHPIKLHPHAWVEPAEFTEFLTSLKFSLLDPTGAPLAWRGSAPDLTHTATAVHSFLIRYPWDFLRANELYLATLTDGFSHGEIHASAVIEGHLHLGAGSRILPGVFIEGNVIIGEGCKIGPNCYLRGFTSIGDKCHIGQSVELKNCLVLSRTNVGHLSYIGDSVLGEDVNLGAGTTTANLRHDGKNHRSQVGGELIDTGRRKFGTIIGDHVHTGIHTAIYPGRKLWPHTTTRPGEIVQQDLHG
jgi:UDP-N-acetylglucosamine diphosphorylase / glucose-1-phosphate thymidylyltransferase / UDP-N-acetylgalactosamine diphosphorylase / glucosamine-1-phosphate N-acetyltransferase / galactosamine-1-phosphate N-acetyltransferase